MIQVLWNFLTLDFDSGILAAPIINALPRTYLSTTFLQNLDPSSPPINAQLAATPNEERLENIKRRRLVLLAQTPISKDEFYTEKKKTCRSNLAQKIHIIFIRFLLYSTHLPNNQTDMNLTQNHLQLFDVLLCHHSKKYYYTFGLICPHYIWRKRENRYQWIRNVHEYPCMKLHHPSFIHHTPSYESAQWH